MKVPLDVRVGYTRNIPEPRGRLDWRNRSRARSLDLIELHDDRLLAQEDIGKAIHVPASLGVPGRAVLVSAEMLGRNASDAVDVVVTSWTDEKVFAPGASLIHWMADAALPMPTVPFLDNGETSSFEIVLLDNGVGKRFPTAVATRERNGSVTGVVLVQNKEQRLPAATLVSTLSSTQVADLIGGSTSHVDRMRRRGCILAVKGLKRFSYPMYQFKDGKILPGLASVIKVASHLPPADLNYMLVYEDGDGTSPVGLLRAGDQVGALDLATRRASRFLLEIPGEAWSLMAELDADLEAELRDNDAVTGNL